MFVIDANILVYLLLVGDRTPQAQALYQLDGDWHSDALILIEFTNVVATSMRVRGLKRATALELLVRAENTMREKLLFVSNTDALEQAIRYSVSAYDARYLAVAERFGVRLITEDQKLRAAAPNATMSISEALSG